jgi:hypothetical protein
MKTHVTISVRMSLDERITTIIIALGGLVVIVLETGAKFRRFKPDRERCNFKGDKNL